MNDIEFDLQFLSKNILLYLEIFNQLKQLENRKNEIRLQIEQYLQEQLSSIKYDSTRYSPLRNGDFYTYSGFKKRIIFPEIGASIFINKSFFCCEAEFSKKINITEHINFLIRELNDEK